MKKIASTFLSAIALASPFAAQAGIDLKQMVKDSVKAQTQPQGGVADSRQAGGQTPDSNAVMAMLAKINLPDIAGVKLGMPVDQAKKILLKANPNFRIMELPRGWGAGTYQGFQVTNRKTPDAAAPDRESIYLLFNEAGTVYLVAREARELSAARVIGRDTFFASVTEKFDTPGLNTSRRRSNASTYFWHYDMAGRLTTTEGGYQDNPCYKDSHSGIHGTVVAFKPDAPATCGVMISAFPMAVAGQPNQNLVDSYIVSMSAPFMVHDVNVLRANASTAEKQRQSEDNAVKTNKPKL
jgi:hypothetical protein